MKREFPDSPIVAVGGIIESGEKILLVKRSNPPDENLWSIPGGAVELGETLIEAIQREIKEECGISVKDGKIIAIIDKIYSQKGKIKYHYCIADFLFKNFEGNLKSGSDALAVKFFHFNEIIKRPDIAESVKYLINLKISQSKNFPFYIKFIEK